MMHLVLAEAEVELVPASISSHPAVRAHARRRGKKATEQLLDSSFHHSAMRKLPEAERRGRPDILHQCLLLALDSPLNRQGLLRVYVHTRNDEVIHVDPSTRIPRSYHRFVGLMEDLFKRKSIPPEKPLLRLEKKNLAKLLGDLSSDRTIIFIEEGHPTKWRDLFKQETVTVVVGCFPHGDFHFSWRELNCEPVCVDPEPLDASTIVARAIYAFEDSIGLWEKRFER